MALLRIPSTEFDRVVARQIVHHASPASEKSWKAVTYAADERVLIAATVGAWLATRVLAPERRREADHVALIVAVAGVLPHLLKLLFDQERPNRTMARGTRRGIPRRSGKAFDAFPSGHAVHIGAICAALSRFFPSAAIGIWLAGGIVAASRLMLLAHWTTDVLVGLASGAAIEKLLWELEDRYWRRLQTAAHRTEDKLGVRRVRKAVAARTRVAGRAPQRRAKTRRMKKANGAAGQD
jgi:undecaprenyl-diphosphatase